MLPVYDADDMHEFSDMDILQQDTERQQYTGRRARPRRLRNEEEQRDDVEATFNNDVDDMNDDEFMEASSDSD